MKLAQGTKSSVRVSECQICNSTDLEEIISLGYLPQVNVMQSIGGELKEDLMFPNELLLCNKCSLIQISHIVDPEVIFPPSYSYTTRTTRVLRDNFAELETEASRLLDLQESDLIVDIGSNDGTLLSNFKKYRIQGVEPTDIAKYANEIGIPTIQSFFNIEVANQIVAEQENAKLVTAANVFAHIENVHSIIEAIKILIGESGVFVSESHYLMGLIETCQYDTTYHEHLRFYSLMSLKYLFGMHGLEIFHAKYIPSHGGSIRVYAAKQKQVAVNPKAVRAILNNEKQYLTKKRFKQFKQEVVKSKTGLLALIDSLPIGSTIGAIGCPSRAITLLNYTGLNEDIVKFVLEAPSSNKINKYCPGSKIPVLAETPELLQSVDYLLMLSWHIADEIIPKLKEKGFKGKFIIPLPTPHIKET